MDIRGVIALYILVIVTDDLIIYYFRELLLSFLMNKHNRKKAQGIHREQSRYNRITMAYVGPMLKNNIQQYRFFQRLYMTDLVMLIPQYALIILFNFLLENGIWILLLAVSIIKGILFLFLWCQFDVHRISRYDKRYRHKK